MPQRLSSRLRACLVAVALAAATAALAAPSSLVPPAPDRPWEPPAADRLPPLEIPAAHDLPEALSGAKVTLGEVLDMALATSPRTRDTWLAAKAAAAELGVRRSTYFPEVNLEGDLTRLKRGSASGTGFNFLQTNYGPALTVSWLLFDFGGRSADIGDARDALLAADWSHNAEIQNVMLDVESAYYQYLGAAAQLAALTDSIQQAQASLDSAEERRRAGVATIADVLQAKTALAQEKLLEVQIEGQMKSIKGALATAIGVRPDVDVEVGELPNDVQVEGSSEKVGTLLEKALADRPDLSAARADALAAHERARRERAARWPVLSFAGSSNRLYYPTLSSPATESYQVQLALRMPLFTGFARSHLIAEAEAEAAAGDAGVESLAQQVTVQVWTSYYDLQSAAQQVVASRALLASAEQSTDVASGRYRAGVGNILDTLTAQSALANARAQEISARASWFIALAQLQHDVGALALPANAPSASPETQP
jgi:outer membrane protein